MYCHWTLMNFCYLPWISTVGMGTLPGSCLTLAPSVLTEDHSTLFV